jgi:enamine deaminase RidA (YjgF/YER057c/UK114 family)
VVRIRLRRRGFLHPDRGDTLRTRNPSCKLAPPGMFVAQDSMVELVRRTGDPGNPATPETGRPGNRTTGRRQPICETSRWPVGGTSKQASPRHVGPGRARGINDMCGRSEGMRECVATAAPWAATVGYSRAVRVDGSIHVSGTASVGDDGRIAHVGDAYLQARRCLEIIVRALRELGAEPEHVVRTRMYVRSRADWEAVGRAHGEVFGDIRPATTMVFTDFIDAEMLVEIEADAVTG